MAHRAYGTVGRNDGIQPAQRVDLLSAHRPGTRHPLQGRTVEHQDDRAAVIVMLAAEVEQTLDRRACDAALLHPRPSVARNDGLRRCVHDWRPMPPVHFCGHK